MENDVSMRLSELAKLVSHYATGYEIASSEEEAEQARKSYQDAYRRFVAACRQHGAHPDWYLCYQQDTCE